LFYNFFRLTNSSLGGQDAWDTDRYLNIWIGDLRIFEPQFNNFEEIVYFALATPPINHTNWPDTILDLTSPYSQGVLIHYVNVGSNNPNLLPSPYNTYNGVVTTGKLLVHETGHYLGLRHIWGDGDCSFDDFISDTPNSSSASQWTCNLSANTCVDNIGGQDLPDMVENYMDYSSGNCQNAFTIEQGDLMRDALVLYYPNLSDQLTGIDDYESTTALTIFPNPSSGIFHLSEIANEIKVLNLVGQTVSRFTNTDKIDISQLTNGVYLTSIKIGSEFHVIQVVKR
jgi:hypothetical protein